MSNGKKVEIVLDGGPTLRVSDEDGQKVAQVPLDAAAIDRMIAALAAIRGEIAPAVPMEFPIGVEMLAIADPRWYSELNILTGMTSLCLRHPGLGWLAFLVPPDGTALMRELFAKQDEARKSGVLNPSTARN